MKSEYCVIDTMVLRKANAPFDHKSKAGRDFLKRILLLKRVHEAKLEVLISRRLLREYCEQILEPRNDFIKAFFEILTTPGRHLPNYHTPWSGNHRDQQKKCRFPSEDEHVLRTAVLDGEGSTIFSEEARMLRTAACIHRNFRVHIVDPVE